ncbi:30S ribosomal protein S16 [Fulvivirga lutea]|uniref:Small ribosomal subunit protein bS16 n=1 Tax=Fulvivirga lutea TaxID=2810512 RepID=A0A974WJX6_9BACT|nr:30S ribosomal protein S16 [Fulvivirga lutea]QSE98522.1 30S ribosomal protein S16 [Fulvivirga lutea]
MAVKIRLARRGRKKQAMYDVVVADARSPRDGKFIEKIGRYNPNTDPAFIELDEEKAFDWVMKGAQPTDTVRAMLSYRGLMLKKHLQIGVNKGAITQEEADKKFDAWLAEKDSKIQAKREKIAKDTDSKAKARLEAEAKVKEARAEALKKKAEDAVAAEAPAAEAEGEEAVAEATEETPAAAATEAPKAEATEAPAEEAKKEESASEEEKKED